MVHEVLGCENYSLKVDMYNFGVVMWEIITRETPYKGVPVTDIKFRVVQSNERPDSSFIPPGCPEQFKKLMHLFWLKEPDKGPGLQLWLTS